MIPVSSGKPCHVEGGCKNLQAPVVEIQMCPGMSTHYTHSSCRDWDHAYCGRNGCIRRGSGAVPAGTGVQQSVGEPPAGGSVSAAWASAEGQAILKTAQCAAGGRCNQGGDGALSGRCHSCQAACHVVCMQVVNEGHACTSCRPEQAGGANGGEASKGKGKNRTPQADPHTATSTTASSAAISTPCDPRLDGGGAASSRKSPSGPGEDAKTPSSGVQAGPADTPGGAGTPLSPAPPGKSNTGGTAGQAGASGLRRSNRRSSKAEDIELPQEGLDGYAKSDLAKTVEVSIREFADEYYNSKGHKDILKEILSKAVEDRLFEEAVLKKVEKKKPDVHPTKKALDKVVNANGVCVMGILKKSLAPKLEEATQSMASATTKLQEELGQDKVGAGTAAEGRKTGAKGKKADARSPTPDTAAKVTLDDTQHAKLVNDVAAKVHELLQPRLFAMAHHIIESVTARTPAVTPPDRSTPPRRSKKAPSRSSSRSKSSKKRRDVSSPSSTETSSSSSDAESPSPKKPKKGRGRPKKIQPLATADSNQQPTTAAAGRPLQAPAHGYYGAPPGFHAAPPPPPATASFMAPPPGSWMMPAPF